MSKPADKTHIDYGYELDLVIRPDARVPMLEREYGSFTGAGIPLFSIGGGYFRTALAEILTRFHASRGYYIVETPIVASSNLFKVSGHLDFYKKNMFLLNIEGHEHAIKPMNCPYHILIFMNQLARNRNKVKLPFKIFEVGRVHRYEPSGSLYGLLRVRAFTQDDAHIITPADMAVDTITNVFREMVAILENVFNMEITPETLHLRLSLSDKSQIGTEFMGTLEEWQAAESVLEEAAKNLAAEIGSTYSKEEGEAAFYGPKIDVVVKLEEAGIEKEWQLGTVQIDFNLPRRFKLYDLIKDVYGDMNVFIVHRALIGSIERFTGVYLEHMKGRLPFALAPLQVAIIAITTGGGKDDVIREVSSNLASLLYSNGLRVGLKEVSKTGIRGDIRQIESTVKPAIIVYIGEKEVEEGYLTVRPWMHSEGKRTSIRVPADSIETAAKGILDLAGELEKGVRSLIGYAPRIPARLDHML